MKKSTILNFLDALSSKLTCCLLSKTKVSNFRNLEGISKAKRNLLHFSMLVLLVFTGFTSWSQIVIDGNPTDWNAASSLPTFTHIADSYGNTIDNQFTQGSKDFNLASALRWNLGQTKNKNDLSNAAAVMIKGNKTILYFCGDRAVVNGDAQIGFWFYLNGTGPRGTTSGDFYPEHVWGDLLVLSDFTGGGRNAIETVYRWVGTGGDSGGGALQLLPVTSTTHTEENNLSTYPVPTGWDYPSDLTPKMYPINAFFEGEIDLSDTALFPSGSTCFTSFLLECRSSQSLDASLDDFAGGAFDVKPKVTVNSATICEGDPAATISATPGTGTIGDYNYEWTILTPNFPNPGNVASFTSSTAVKYSVVIERKNSVLGCKSDSASGELKVNPKTTATDLTPATRCVGGADVVFTTIAGGTGPFSYIWKKGTDIIVGATTNSYTVAGPMTLAQAATYTVEVTGLCGMVKKSAVLTVNPNPTANAGPDEAKCQTKPSGPTLFTLAGSATNGTIAWSEIAHTGNAVSTINTPTSLTSTVDVAGIGTVTLRLTVTSASCGTATDDVVLTVNPNPAITCPTPATAPVLCKANQATAQAQADIDFAAWFALAPVSDADYLVTATYVYSPAAATPTPEGTAPLILAFANPSIKSTDVTVTWTIKNKITGCENSCSSKWTLKYECAIGCDTSVTNLTCNGDKSGAIKVTAGGGTQPYIIYLYKSPDFINPIADSGSLSTEPGVYTFSGLAAGDYLTESTDVVLLKGSGKTCPATLTEPDALTCSVSKVKDATCNADKDGSATVTPVGGNGGYTYKWDNGETTATATALIAGLHSVEVTDSKGCKTSCDVTIGEPDPLSCFVTKDKDVTCYGEKNGSATVTPVGGNGGYTYLWDSGETTATATALSAGLHSVAVTDSKGCKTSCDVTIGEPDLLSCSVVKIKDATCIDGKDGSATVTPKGGNGGYTYLWDNGETDATAIALGVGLHTVAVTDSKGCKTSCDVTIDYIPCGKALCTYTQGYYGNIGGMSCAEGNRYTTTDLITKALGYYGGTMKVGYGLNTISISSPSCVIAVLPGGGGSYKLSGAKDICSINSYLKNGRINNTLLAQTITLGFNIGINSTLANFALKAGTLATAAPDGGCGTDIAKLRSCSAYGYAPTINEYKYFTIPAVVDLLPNKTVQGLFDMANQALGGEVLPAGISLTNLANAVDVINNAFDGCRISMGYDQKPLLCNLDNPEGFVAFEVPIVNNQLTVKYKFAYVSDVTIDVFDTTGAKVFSKADTNSYLDKEVVLNYNFNTGTQKVYIIRVTTKLGHSEQKVVSSPY